MTSKSVRRLTGAVLAVVTSLAFGAACRGQAGVPPTAQAGSAPRETTSDPTPEITLPRSVAADGRPQINGPRVASATPGRMFMFRVPATGDAPLTFSAESLPAGLVMDAATGIISGSLKEPLSVATTIHVKNAKGESSRQLVIVAGTHKLALTPPLGWNSWNAFGMRPTDTRIRDAADGLIASGLAAHGFAYVCIDDGWEIPTPGRGVRGALGVAGTPTRGPDGSILCNANFPDMKALGDYIHSRGLKFGIYSSPGPTTCQGFAASWQHEEQDAKTWAAWGVDYVKYDWCSYDQVAQGGGAGAGRRRNYDLATLKKPYQLIRTALDQLDRDMVLSMCQYGMGNVWEWGAENGINANVWRSTGDIRDNWPNVSRIGFSQNGHETFTGPGHWNDTDMLVVGKVGWTYEPQHDSKLTQDEQLTHVGLWSILAAPLILGCDLTKLDEFTTALLSNDEVLDIDQDPLGRQGKRISPASPADNPNASATAPQQVWARELWDGTIAVGLFNLGNEPAKVMVSLKELNEGLGMNLTGKQPVRDVWQLKSLPPIDDVFSVEVRSHGMVFLKIGTPRSEAQCIAAIVKLHAPGHDSVEHD